MERRNDRHFDDLTLKEVFSKSESSIVAFVGIGGFLAMTVMLMVLLTL